MKQFLGCVIRWLWHTIFLWTVLWIKSCSSIIWCFFWKNTCLLSLLLYHGIFCSKFLHQLMYWSFKRNLNTKKLSCKYARNLCIKISATKIICIAHNWHSWIQKNSRVLITAHNIKQSSSQTRRIGPFDPFRLQSYSCSRQRFFGLPIVLLPCGL
jgi:hypothetical protein